MLARSMAGRLHGCLAEFLDPLPWSELAAIGVAVGPGSFTGSRLGVTVARTLGQTLDIPVFGVSTLAAVAYTYGSTQRAAEDLDHPLDLWVEMDAQRGDWLVGQYRFDPLSTQVDCRVEEQLWSDGAWTEQKAQSQIPCLSEAAFQDPPPAAAIAQLAAQHLRHRQISPWSTVEPVYSRQPPIHS